MRLEQLTFTRFIAAISIVVFHYGKNIFPFNIDSISFLFRHANIGVSYFFILSGYVMMIAYGNKNKIEFGDYIKRRFARIYPVYGLAIFVLLAYYIILQKPINLIGLTLNFTLFQSWIPGYALSFNTPGWSLSVEMFFYFSFPFLFNFIYSHYSYKKIAIPFFLIFICSQIVFHVLRYTSFYKGFFSASHDIAYYFPLMHLSEFLIGNMAGLFFLKGLKVRNYDLPIIGLILLCSILLKFDIGINYHNGMLAFVFVPFIILISSNNGVLTKISNIKGLVFLGEISYGIYILQRPIYLWVESTMNYLNISSPVLCFYFGLVALIVFSGISYRYIETPLRKLINKKRINFFIINRKKSAKSRDL